MIGTLGYGYIGSKLNGQAVELQDIDRCSKLYYLAAESQPGLEWIRYHNDIKLTLDVVSSYCGELVYTSTIKMYDSYQKVNPQDNYSTSKKICEDIIIQAGKEGLKYQILRLANVISPGVKYGAFYNLLKQAREGVVEFYPGSYRPFITLEQAVEAIQMDKPPGIYNVSCPAIYIEDVIKLLAKKYKFKTKALKGEPTQLEPNYSDMKDLGWNPRTSLENVEEVLCSL